MILHFYFSVIFGVFQWFCTHFHFVLYLSKYKIKEIACVAAPRTDPRNE